MHIAIAQGIAIAYGQRITQESQIGDFPQVFQWFCEKCDPLSRPKVNFTMFLYCFRSLGKYQAHQPDQLYQPETGSGQAERTQGFPRVFHWFVWRPLEISSGSAGKGLGQAEQTHAGKQDGGTGIFKLMKSSTWADQVYMRCAYINK